MVPNRPGALSNAGVLLASGKPGFIHDRVSAQADARQLEGGLAMSFRIRVRPWELNQRTFQPRNWLKAFFAATRLAKILGWIRRAKARKERRWHDRREEIQYQLDRATVLARFDPPCCW